MRVLVGRSVASHPRGSPGRVYPFLPAMIRVFAPVSFSGDSWFLEAPDAVCHYRLKPPYVGLALFGAVAGLVCGARVGHF